MKRVFFCLTWAAACMALLLSCDDERQGALGGADSVITATIGDNGSRTAVGNASATEINVNWLPEDRIGVFGDQGTANTAFGNQNSTTAATASFAGRLKVDEKPLYAYYPYYADGGVDPKDFGGELPDEQNYSTVDRHLADDWKIGRPTAEGSSDFVFENIFPMFYIKIVPGTTALTGEKLRSISMTVAGKELAGGFSVDLGTGAVEKKTTATDCVKLNITDTPQLGASDVEAFANVFPETGLSDKTMNVEIATDSYTASFDITLRVDEIKPNTFYDVVFDLEELSKKWTLSQTRENAAWVPGLESRLACANTVFALTGKPFMHKIRVPEDYSALSDFNYSNDSKSGHNVVPVKSNSNGTNAVVGVYNLPAGLHWNDERKLVYGTPVAAGKYVYTVEYRINGQEYAEGIKLTVSDSYPQATPMMGWQSWNVMRFDISEELIRKQIDAMASDYLSAGYNYVGIDDGWSYRYNVTNNRRRLDSDGNIAIDTSKFPQGLSTLTAYAHSKGIKLGIYSDVALSTCGGFPGSYQRETTDAAAFAAWGFDMLKEDYFDTYMDQYFSAEGTMTRLQDKTDRATARMLYKRMGDALAAQSHHVLLYMCEWGTHQPWRWAPEVGAQCWRMSYDDADGWYGSENGRLGVSSNSQNKGRMGLRNTIDLMRNLWSYTGINRYNDADMICAGIRGNTNGPSAEGVMSVGLNDNETQTAFAMWCMWSSPILLGYDLSQSLKNPSDKSLLLNSELIAINQDPMGQGAEWVKKSGGLDYYQKDLANGDVAIAVVNLNDTQANYSISIADFDALDASATYSVRNLLTKSNENASLSASNNISGSIGAHGVYVVRLTGK